MSYNSMMKMTSPRTQNQSRWLWLIVLSLPGCTSPPPEPKPSKPGQTIITVSKTDYSLGEKIECDVEMTAMTGEALPNLIIVELKKKSTTYGMQSMRPQNVTKLINPDGQHATISLSLETTHLRETGNFMIQATSLYLLEPGTSGTSREPNKEGQIFIPSKPILISIKKAKEQPRR